MEPERFAPVVVAPTYNNAGALRGVIEGVRALGLAVIVVDDGSTDETAAILHDYESGGGVMVETHTANRGKAVALVTGFARAEREGFTHAATIDTDGQLPPGALPGVIGAARESPRALVLGVRRWFIEGCPRKSVVGRAAANVAVWAESGLRVADTQCGLRVYPLALIAAAPCRAGRYAFETEIIVRAGWSGWPVVQVPVPCTYTPPGGRISHFRPWRDSLAAAGMHARLAAAAIPRRLRGAGRNERSRN